jgi:hypothetical protein
MYQQVYRGIQLADGEEIVREYHAATQKRTKIDIFVAVTTRRLLRVGQSKGFGGRSVFMEEAYIHDISGVNAFYARYIRLLRLISGIIEFIIGILIMQYALNFYPILFVGVLFLLVGLYSAVSAIIGGKAVSLSVYSKAAMGVVVSLGAKSSRERPSLFSIGLRGVREAYVKPGRDAERMTRELSACIIDLQTDPEHALKKWQWRPEIATSTTGLQTSSGK